MGADGPDSIVQSLGGPCAIRRSARRDWGACCAAALLCSLLAGGAYAQDIASFKVTDVRGHARLEYVFDDQDRGASGFETSGSWEEELFLEAESFVYHPGFFNMVIGAGPMLTQQQFESTGGSNRNSEVLWNYATEFNLLDLKAYPVSLFLSRNHPAVSTSLSGRFLTEVNEYGARGRLREVLVPVNVDWKLRHWDSLGSGLGTSVDEDVDQAVFRAEMNYREKDKWEVRYDWSERLSSSGSPGLPIQATTTENQLAYLGLENYFGAKQQVEIRQGFTLRETLVNAGLASDSTYRLYNGRILLPVGETNTGSAHFSHSGSEQQDARSRNNSGALGLYGSPLQGLDYDSRLRASREQDTGFQRDQAGAYGLVRYSMPVSFGRLGVNASLDLNRTDQEAESETVNVFDEPATLLGTVPVDLANPFVDVATVVVTNEPKTQVFVEELDYRLITVGSVTSIQRLIDGNIADGQTVLLEYQYRTGGTVDYDTLTSSLGLDANLFRVLNLYARYFTTDNTVDSGFPTTPLNDRQRMDVGGSVDLDLGQAWRVGAEARYVDNQEDISPFVSSSTGGYILRRFPYAVTVKLSGTLEQRDIENSDEDRDLQRYDLVAGGTVPGGGRLSYLASFARDQGGSRLREELRHALKFEWSYRQLRCFVNLQYVDETLGTTQRTSTRLTAQIYRVF